MNKQDILGGAPALPVEIVETPEWPNSPKTRVRMMNGMERDSFEDAVSGAGNKSNFRAKFLVRCICDEAGARVFADDDATALGQQSGLVIFRLFAKAWVINGMPKADAEQLAGN